MKRIAVMLLFCGLTLGAAGAAFAQPDNEDFQGPGREQPLTPQQLEQAKKIFQENYASTDAIRQQLAAKREQLNTVLSSDNPDKGQIESLSRQIGELRGKLLAARVDARKQLQQEGLPSDAYGPNAPGRSFHNGPEVWNGGPRHGRHGGHHGGNYGPRGYWGCPGMMGCW